MTDQKPEVQEKSAARSRIRRATAVGMALVIVLLVTAYIRAVIAGLPQDRRIDAATLGIIGIGALVVSMLLRPDILGRVARLEVAGWKLEMEKRQEKYDKQLTDIQLILPILLPEAERQILLDLADKNTTKEVSDALRNQLRHLRSLKLIRMVGDKWLYMMPNEVIDIGHFVELTDLGRKWVDRIKEIEVEASKTAYR